jgi:multicopper oxidase
MGPLGVYHTWLYNGKYPGPEIRVREGDRLQVTLVNGLPEATTVHWHGVPVPNAMDGVPGITQPAVAPGSRFVYTFPATPAGSYLYHSHFGLQLDRALLGPLVIEELAPTVPYDREFTVVLDDYLPGAPAPGGGMGMGMGMGSGPRYVANLINGRPAGAPAVFNVTSGEQVRLRLMNLGSATTFRVALAGHRLTVTHADGQPVQPVTVDAVVIGMGERYDVVVKADNPGAWFLAAASLTGGPSPAKAVFRYTDSAATRPPRGQVPAGLTSGRLLLLSDLVALNPGPTPPRIDRYFDLALSGGMMGSVWTIGGQAYPRAAPLDISRGQWIRMRLTNMSMALHPMHLHGHFFRVGSAIKDTVLVHPMRGIVTLEFLANNPGNWFFHCHNTYHLEGGMARVFQYLA